MKKRVISITLAVLMVLSLCLATVAPAMAAEPNDNKPVAWVSWAGTNAASENVKGSDHEFKSILVKQLTDGSSVGHMITRDRETGEDITYYILKSHFKVEMSGAKVADLLTSVDNADGTWYLWFRLVDNGEPGKGTDTMQLFSWLTVLNPWEDFTIWEYSPDGYPAGWWQPNEPQLFDGFPTCWFPAPGFYTPHLIAPGNVQINITDAYVP